MMRPSSVPGGAALSALAFALNAAGAVAQSGPVLTVDAAARGIFDSNPDRSEQPLEAFGGGGDLLLRAANRLRAPTLQLEYGASLRRSSPDHENDGTGHRINVLAGVPFAEWLRADLIGRGSRGGGSDEELSTGDELMVSPRVDLMPTRSTRLRSYGAQRWRTTPDTDAPPSIGRYAGVELRQRIGPTTFLADVRYEEFMPPDSTRDWQRRALLVGIAQPLFRNVALELEARFRERDYPRRMVELDDDVAVPRRDTDQRYGISLVFDNGSGTEIRLDVEREMRRSNDDGRAWDADRATIMVRRRLFALGSRRDPPGIDDRPGTDALRNRRNAVTVTQKFEDVVVAGTGLCGLGSDGALCWPSLTTSRSSAAPALIAGHWQRVEAGPGRACGIDPQKRVHCWTWHSGDLAGGAVDAQPRLVRSDLQFEHVAVGATHACGLTSDGAAWCWGDNSDGQLGTGLATPSESPVAVAGAVRFRAITVGARHTCALDLQGAAHCWGANESGQAAVEARRALRPRALDAPAFVAISAGSRHTCALTTSGSAYCWGESARGQAGGAGAGPLRRPTRIESAVSFTTISAGWAHTCALAADGQAWCWGANRHGQLGTGRTDSDAHPQPVRIAAERTFIALSASFRTCALTTDQQLYCWGGGGISDAADRNAARPRPVALTETR